MAGELYAQVPRCHGRIVRQLPDEGPDSAKKKGPFGGCERPKSREETPKEGIRHRIIIDTALHNVSLRCTKFKMPARISFAFCPSCGRKRALMTALLCSQRGLHRVTGNLEPKALISWLNPLKNFAVI